MSPNLKLLSKIPYKVGVCFKATLFEPPCDSLQNYYQRLTTYTPVSGILVFFKIPVGDPLQASDSSPTSLRALLFPVRTAALFEPVVPVGDPVAG
jgi:hypothetical protein